MKKLCSVDLIHWLLLKIISSYVDSLYLKKMLVCEAQYLD